MFVLQELLLEYISPEQLEMCCRKMGDYKKVTGDLLVCMFSEEELLQSSVTGQRTSKEPLNKHKLDALIGKFHVLWNWFVKLIVLTLLQVSLYQTLEIPLKQPSNSELGTSWETCGQYMPENCKHISFFL